MSLNKIIREELNKKYKLRESSERILNEKDEYKKFHHTLDYLHEMIESGYDEKRMESELQESGIWDSIKNLFGSSVTSQGKLNAKDIGSKGLWGGWSQIKEWLIMQALGFIGFKGPLAESFATALSEMNIADLIAVFRGKESCKRHGSTVADALSEAIVTYILQSTKGNSMAYNFIKNTLFEYIKQSQFGETTSNFLCDAAYNFKQKNIPNLSSSNPTSTKNQS